MGRRGLMGLIALTAIAFVIVSLGVVGSSSAGAPTSSSSLKAASTNGTYDFPGVNLSWNAGNLCHVSVHGSTWDCSYSASRYGGGMGHGCGCEYPLTYNFSANNTWINININLGGARTPGVYINIHGKGNTVNLTVSSCSGGQLNVSVLGQDNVFNFYNKANSLQSNIQFYTDSDTYNVWFEGSHSTGVTDFVGAFVLKEICPGKNQSNTDTYTVSFSGRENSQSIVYANAVGYNSPVNTVTGSWWNSVSYENTTTFACSWAIAPAPNCSGHGMGGEPILMRNDGA